MPSVAIKGGSFPRFTSAPFIAPPSMPKPIPARQPISVAAIGETPAAAIARVVFIVTTPQSAKREPTARSMPPAIIIYVMPRAIIPLYEHWRKMFVKFVTVLKLSLEMQQIMSKIARAMYAPAQFLKNDFIYVIVNICL